MGRIREGPLRRHILVACLVAISQSGCFGAIWFGNGKEGYSPSADHEYYGDAWAAGSSKKEDVLRVEGKPKREYVEEGNEVWIYNHDVAWRGFLLAFIFPVPLIFPAGMNEVSFTFRDDNLVLVTKEKAKPSGFGCMVIPYGTAFCHSNVPPGPSDIGK